MDLGGGMTPGHAGRPSRGTVKKITSVSVSVPIPSMASRWNNSPTTPARLLPAELPVKADWAPSSGQRLPAADASRGSDCAALIPAPLRVQEQQRQGRQAGHHVEHQHDSEHRPVAEFGGHHHLQQADDRQLPVDRAVFLLEEQDHLQTDDQVGQDQDPRFPVGAGQRTAK